MTKSSREGPALRTRGYIRAEAIPGLTCMAFPDTPANKLVLALLSEFPRGSPFIGTKFTIRAFLLPTTRAPFTRYPRVAPQSLTRSNGALQAEAEAARCSLEATRAREAGLLEAERAATADAHTLRASLAMASVETETAAATAAEAKDLEVRRLEEKVTRLLQDAQEKACQVERQLAVHTEQAATAAEERKAWAVRSTEWETEGRSLNAELGISKEKAADLEKELEAAVAVGRDLVSSRREVERELRIELEVAQVGRCVRFGMGYR